MTLKESEYISQFVVKKLIILVSHRLIGLLSLERDFF